MSQTSVDAKHEVDQTRAHLDETLTALTQQAGRALDVKAQIQTNRGLQIGLAGGAVVLGALLIMKILSARRRSSAERLFRKLSLDKVRVAKGERKGHAGELESGPGALTSIIVKAAEAALTALAANYAKQLVTRAPVPHDQQPVKEAI